MTKSYYNNHIIPSESFISKLKDFSEMEETELTYRVLYAIKINNYDSDDCLKFSRLITDRYLNIQQERKNMEKFIINFPYEFTTDNNNYLNELQPILKRFRSSLYPMKELLDKFTPPRHPSPADCVKYDLSQHYTINCSCLTCAPYQQDMFPELFPSETHGFINAILKYRFLLEHCLKLIDEAQSEVKRVRENPSECKRILQKFNNQIIRDLDGFMDLFGEDELKEEMGKNELFLEYINQGEDKFATSKYHNVVKKDMKRTSLLLMASEAYSQNILPEEYRLWGNDKGKVLNARRVIAQFDSLIPEGTRKNGISVLVCAFIVAWGKCDNVKGAVGYFHDNYRGTYKIAGYNAINRFKTDVVGRERKEEVETFLANINSLLSGQSVC